MGQQEAAALVRKYQDLTGMTQEAIAHELSQALGKRIGQSQVSGHLNGTRWRDPDLAGAYVRVLSIPPDEMAAAMGYPLQGKAPKKWTIKDVVKADPTLSPAAKRHLLSQYDLLQMATRHERSDEGLRRKRNRE